MCKNTDPRSETAHPANVSFFNRIAAKSENQSFQGIMTKNMADRQSECLLIS
jgi:hypothetical protein